VLCSKSSKGGGALRRPLPSPVFPLRPLARAAEAGDRFFRNSARGDARPDSDYDFVLIKEGKVDEHATSASVYVDLARDSTIVAAVDIIPVSVAGFEERSARAGSPIALAAREGIIVYAG
jgi:hypothetical protein